MAKQYEASSLTNRLMSWMARRGMGKTEVMTTTGRKSGEPREVPVTPLVHDGVEYVVSPYGQVGWVHNVRANPTVTLRHGSKQRQVLLEEMTDAPGPAIVALYHSRESYARPYMEVPENPTVEDFASRASMFPVFRVTEPRT